MSSLLPFMLLALLQLLAGFGVLTLFKIRLKPALFFPLALLLGISVFSVVPFFLQLLYIPLTGTTIYTALFIVTLFLNAKMRDGLRRFREDFYNSKFRIRLYEIPFLLVIAFIVFVSVWRCFYYPPTPRDLTSGAEAIAEYAVREKSMINSLFSVDLQTTNNPFKPPFLTSLQLIYKYAGFPFGQVWLSTLFICFLVFLYHAISLTVHRIFAGLLLLFLLAVPEMYAYTFMALFDYPNAVFFFLSLYFLFDFFDTKQTNKLALAALLMGIATYIRSETLVFAVLITSAIFWHYFKSPKALRKFLSASLLFLFPATILYLLSVTVYLNYYLPVTYNVEALINTDLLNLKPLWQRFIDMNTALILGKNGIHYYGYLLLLFPGYALINMAWNSKKENILTNWLYAILVVYFGYPFLGHLLPLLDIDHSTKRGLFKIFPLIVLYISRSQLLIDLSDQLKEWEAGKVNDAPAEPGIS